MTTFSKFAAFEEVIRDAEAHIIALLRTPGVGNDIQELRRTIAAATLILADKIERLSLQDRSSDPGVFAQDFDRRLSLKKGNKEK